MNMVIRFRFTVKKMAFVSMEECKPYKAYSIVFLRPENFLNDKLLKCFASTSVLLPLFDTLLAIKRAFSSFSEKSLMIFTEHHCDC